MIEDPHAAGARGGLGETELREALADAIQRLPDREKLVITLYYYEELTLREIGEVLGVTESRVSQLHTKAILRLKLRVAARSPPGHSGSTGVGSPRGRGRMAAFGDAWRRRR